ncbi:MAG TPA: hypothetical protein VMS17_22250 [Gemmataceae bacterium]|nr:hypothetical protein [Gemmataceae bacterium]
MFQIARRRGCTVVRPVWAALIAVLLLAAAASAAEPWTALINPDNSLAFSFLHDDRPVFDVSLGGWGPKWAWIGLDAHEKAENGKVTSHVPFVVNKDKGETIDVRFEAWQPSARQVAFRCSMESAQDVPLTLLIAGFHFDDQGGKGTLTLTHHQEKPTKMELPVRGIHSAPAASQADFAFDKCGNVSMQLDPPCPITFDNGMRVVLAADMFPKGKKAVTLTLTFPDDAAFCAGQADLDKFSRTLAGPDWFPFQPSKELVSGVIDMDRWLDGPAGKHGGVRLVKDGFAFEDGTPIKFWGVNLSYTGSAPDHATAEFVSARFAKYGINAVRMHKFSYPIGHGGIGDPNDSTLWDAKGLDQFDYFASKLKEHGVYFGWSHTYGFHVCPGDAKRLLAYDEIDKNLKGNTYAFIHFAEDVQDLMIEKVVNLLKHKNPYTGMNYAEDPALCYIELQNEDDIFFYTSEQAFNACPTYKKKFLERFAAWLKDRYASQEKLQAAWGDALQKSETLVEANITPQLNPWFFGEDHLPGQKGGARRRLLDTAAFLHDVQDKFYSRFAKAIRDAGYKGPLNGSPWQAPSMVPHYYNLKSDYDVGYIDRHNYFDGKGPEMFASMLTHPGSGYFSSGLQQVIDRPFGLSEWIHVYPNVYAAEGPPIVAVYGMGLQGWDASYEFQSQSNHQVFDETAGGFPWGVWEADTPTSLGQFPALARMVARGDVKEAEIISVRRISPTDLAEGKFSFSDKVEQKGDVKTFGGSCPPEALAAGRCVVEFTDKPQPSQLPDMSRYRKESVIHSTTGQLAWDTSDKGFFTVNTAGTKAVVGFADGKEQTLGDVKIKLDTPFASVFVTALEPGKDLSNGDRALIAVMARDSNTGFTYFAPDDRVLKNGGPPILLEPVKASLTIAGRPIAAVNILDHDGRRTGRTLAVTDGQFTIDGAKDKAIYYEVLFR